MKKLFAWIVNARVLDGYLGLLGIILFYRILAQYHGTISIFELSLMAWQKSIFHIGVTYWERNRRNRTYSFYPPITVSIKVAKFSLVDTAREAREKTHERAEKIMAEHRSEEKENERLIAAAKAAGL